MKTDAKGEYVNIVMTAVLETKGIIHYLLPPYVDKSNRRPGYMDHTMVMKVRSITLNYADVIRQVLCGEVCSMPVYIKNYLPHSTFKVKKLLYDMMFSDKRSIK
jgi:hypothetical protein